MTQRSGRARCVGRQVQGVVACRPPDPHRLPQPDRGCAGSEATTSLNSASEPLFGGSSVTCHNGNQRQCAKLLEVVSWVGTKQFLSIINMLKWRMDHMFKEMGWLLYTAIRNSFSFLWASTISLSIFFHMRLSEPLLTHIIATKARICCASI